MDATDALTQFIESRAIRYQHDRTYRQNLVRESAPRIGETLKQQREREAA